MTIGWWRLSFIASSQSTEDDERHAETPLVLFSSWKSLVNDLWHRRCSFPALSIQLIYACTCVKLVRIFIHFINDNSDWLPSHLMRQVTANDILVRQSLLLLAFAWTLCTLFSSAFHLPPSISHAFLSLSLYHFSHSFLDISAQSHYSRWWRTAFPRKKQGRSLFSYPRTNGD